MFLVDGLVVRNIKCFSTLNPWVALHWMEILVVCLSGGATSLVDCSMKLLSKY